MVPAAEFAAVLPVAALTCIDPRLNRLFPGMLGIAEEQFVWLRNAGNIITGPLSSTVRSLALACAIKGAKEVAVIGHTDCLVAKTGAMQLLDRLAALGVSRDQLPVNLVEYFGLFATERQNVIRGAGFVRSSPLIGAGVPVHGLLIDVNSGRLEWVVDGYEAAAATTGRTAGVLETAEQALGAFTRIGELAVGGAKFSESKIGHVVTDAENLLHKAEQIEGAVHPPALPPPPPPPPKVGGDSPIGRARR
jgi:carbonic anhydrase